MCNVKTWKLPQCRQVYVKGNPGAIENTSRELLGNVPYRKLSQNKYRPLSPPMNWGVGLVH